MILGYFNNALASLSLSYVFGAKDTCFGKHERLVWERLSRDADSNRRNRRQDSIFYYESYQPSWAGEGTADAPLEGLLDSRSLVLFISTQPGA